MKIIYFLKNGRASVEDITKKAMLESKGYKVFFSNGSVAWGFEDSCDAIVLGDTFEKIETWAKSKGIEILVDKKEEKPKPKPEKNKKPTE